MLKSKKQEAFAQHFALHGKPSEAYRHAYEAGRMKPNTVAVKASELLRDGNVSVRIKELQSVIADKAKQTFNMNAETMLARLVEIDGLDVADVIDERGKVRPVQDWPREWRVSINAIEVVQVPQGDGVVVKVKLPDKLKNLQMLGRHVDVQTFKDKIEHDVNEGLADKIHAARERARAAMKGGDE